MGEKYKDLIAGAVITSIYVAIFFFGFRGLAMQFVLLFAILFPAYALGRRLFPWNGTISSTLSGTLVFCAVFSLLQTAAFYSGTQLNARIDSFTLIATMLLSYGAIALFPEPSDETKQPERVALGWKEIFSIIAVSSGALILTIFIIRAAILGGTTESIRTPWPLLPPGTLAALAVIWLAVIATCRLAGRSWPSYLMGSLALFATTCLTPFIYRIGFGFDGFLHVASEKVLAQTGFLSPKPLYYIGQYVYTGWLSRFFDLPIQTVDRWLVPIAAPLILGLCLYAVRRVYGGKFSNALLPLLPLSIFVATTPQSFSYILGFGAVILALGRHDRNIHPLAVLALGAWSAAVHPLAGIPLFAISLVLLVIIGEKAPLLRWILGIIGALLAAAAVPLMFYLLSSHSGTVINWDFSKITDPKPWLDFLGNFNPLQPNRFSLWAGWANSITSYLPLLLALGALVEIFRASGSRRRVAVVLFVSALGLLLSSALLKSLGEFTFLNDYERGNYADRLVILGSLILSLAAWPTFSSLLSRTLDAPLLPAATLIALFLAFVAGNTYNSLPRHDALTVGRGWSTGRADIEAVRTIENDANDSTYTVLANQSVSAAAVREFGFKRYVGDIFYYPIPTGGPLYDIFLRMTYNDPSRGLAFEAGRLGKSNIVYVVLNDYWYRAETTAEALSAIADQEWSVGDSTQGLGRSLKIYKFDLSKPAKAPAKTTGS